MTFNKKFPRATLFCAFMIAFPAIGQETSAPASSDVSELRRALNEQARLIAEQARSLKEQEKNLAETQRRLEALQTQVGGKKQSTVASGDANKTSPPVATAKRPSVGPLAQTEKPNEVETVGRAPAKPVQAKPPEIAADIFDQRGVLTPRGSFIIEPSLQYTHSSVNRVALEGFTIIPAITIGLIDIREVNRNTFAAALAGRFGVSDRLEIEARVPYIYRGDSTVTRELATPTTGDEVFDVNGSNIGDVEVALHYQFNRGLNGWPFLIGNLRVKSDTGTSPFDVDIDPRSGLQEELPTGSGFWAVQPSITAIYPSDPAVFFGNLSYLYNIERDVGEDFGDIDPGDVIGVNLGMGFSLNERASWSVGYEHNVILKTEQNGSTLPNSQVLQVGSLLFGYSFRLNERRNINFSLGVGATEDAPDVQMTLRVPTRY